MKISALTIRLDRALQRQLAQLAKRSGRSRSEMTRGLCADVFRAVVAEHELVIGEVILDEIRRVLRTKLRLPAERIAAVEALLGTFPVVPRPAAPSAVAVRDPSDRWILATAAAGAADVLVTGDLDMLAVAEKADIRILAPRAFWDLLRGGPAS
jgi:putative PIN family toxin of toxin-antitoxin system